MLSILITTLRNIFSEYFIKVLAEMVMCIGFLASYVALGIFSKVYNFETGWFVATIYQTFLLSWN